MSNPINNRYDFVLLFDVKDGNPNGDPDAGNLPRIDPETGHGLVTDVCLKRKVRNYVQISKGSDQGYDIFIKEKSVLNESIGEGYKSLGIDLNEPPKDDKDGKKRKTKGEAQGSEIEKGRQHMCESYYDVRTFGAVMSTGANAGQVRGPVQLTFARSVGQVVPLEHSITRVAKTTEERAETGGSEMGRKFTIPYGLYRAHGFVSAAFADNTNGKNGTGFSEKDLDIFWDALINMFEHDRSAARGQMATRKLIVFKHDSNMGSASAHKLFDMVKITPTDKPARDFCDYEDKISIPSQVDMPQGVTLDIKL
jgi:CRISPR-associated protein Csd2